MDHSSQQDPPLVKVVDRPIRRVRSPPKPRAWVPRSYHLKPKTAGPFHKFDRDDRIVHRSGFNYNRGRGQFKSKFYFNPRELYKGQAAAERNREESYSQKNGPRVFEPRSSSSREQDKQRSGSKSDKNQSRERDHGGSRSKEPEPEQSTAKQAAARDRAIQKKRKEIDQVYFQECEMFGLVVKMLIAKDPSLETPIQASLQQNLRDIGARCVEAMEKFIEDYDSREI